MRLILCGGGSGEQNYYANKKLNEIIDHNKPVLYIPLAMDESVHSYDSCYEWITEELSNVDIPGIEMVRTFDELATKDYNNYCALFIGGGNTYKLLKGIKDSGVFEKIREFINNDGIVIGGSAGAVIFGNDINVISKMDPNDVELKDTKGFNVLNGISIFPHYTNSKTEEIHQKYTNHIIEYSKVEDVIALPEEDAIYVSDNTVEIIGSRPYYNVRSGIIEKVEIKNKRR